MRKILILVVSTILVSCSVSKTIPLKFRTYDEPAIGQSATKELGDKVLLKGEENYQDALQITEAPDDITISMAKFPYGVGAVLPLHGSNKDWYLYYEQVEGSQSRGYYSAGIAKNKKNPNIVRPFFESAAGFMSKRIENFNVKETTWNNPKCAKCFKQELIYNGKVETSMRFIYREYIENMARPAFTQELQYDLSESTTIGFKGARIEIEKATNTSITYKVLSSFQQ